MSHEGIDPTYQINRKLRVFQWKLEGGNSMFYCHFDIHRKKQSNNINI